MRDCAVRQTHISAGLICLLAVAFGAMAAEYFVDQKHPQAADGNPGTEQAPWKTIQKAAETVVAGDTAWIKGGEYRETVWIKNDGEFKHGKAKFISFVAWGDDPVVLVGTRLVAADEWQPVAGQKDVFAVSYPHPSVRYPEPGRSPTQVFVNGKRLPEAVKISGVDEATGEAVSPDAKGRAVRREHVFYEVTDDTPNCWTVDTKKRLVIVNAGGGNPAVGRTIEISEHDVWFDGRQYIRIKGLRLHRSRLGLHCSGSFHCIIEDCLITEPGGSLRTGRSAGIHLGGAGNIIRRNTIVDSQFQGIYWTGHGFVIEDNLINRCGLHPAILYAEAGRDLPDDPYDGILAPRHRDLVKKAFNAMVNAKHELTRPPYGLVLRETGMTWRQLSCAIREKHKPISDAFYSDRGTHLQFIDSELAERVMLHFAQRPLNAAVLPVHDSFIMHHGYETDLRAVMDKFFTERFGRSIRLKAVLDRMYSTADGPKDPHKKGKYRFVTDDVFELFEYYQVGHEQRWANFRS